MQQEPDNLKILKHDIKNQLSNIQFAIEELRYELQRDVSADQLLCINLIAESCVKINDLLNSANGE